MGHTGLIDTVLGREEGKKEVQNKTGEITHFVFSFYIYIVY